MCYTLQTRASDSYYLFHVCIGQGCPLFVCHCRSASTLQLNEVQLLAPTFDTLLKEQNDALWWIACRAYGVGFVARWPHWA